MYNYCMTKEHWDYINAKHEILFEGLIILNDFKVIVELGVCMASTTKSLCRGALYTGGMVYGYDFWSAHSSVTSSWDAAGSKELCDNILLNEGYSNFELTNINTQSQEFKELINKKHNFIDFAFIDANHSYYGVKNDFDIIYPKLSSFGIIAFHDTFKIDGSREFMIDLRTIYNDGTFDIVDFPFGNGDRKTGVSLLVKRSYNKNIKIDEIYGSISSEEEIYNKENNWYNNQIKKYE